MEWQLEQVGLQPECKIDNSGVYATIHRQEKRGTHKEYAHTYIHIRVDIMRTEDNEPIGSFYGPAEDVRKRVILFIQANNYRLSAQHVAYIGYEIARASLIDGFIQDQE